MCRFVLCSLLPSVVNTVLHYVLQCSTLVLDALLRDALYRKLLYCVLLHDRLYCSLLPALVTLCFVFVRHPGTLRTAV
jgi:hypothetical protein